MCLCPQVLAVMFVRKVIMATPWVPEVCSVPAYPATVMVTLTSECWEAATATAANA